MKARRRRTRAICLALACAALLLGTGCLRPDANRGRAEEDVVSLSVPSGFYDAPFYLEMTAGTDRIYYTTDSTEPDENAIPYTGPILISDASERENVYSMIGDVCPEMNGEALERAGRKPKFPYRAPGSLIDKATVIRAACYDAFGNRGADVVAVYFVGFDKKEAYDDMNVVAITTDPGNLFDYDTGIYVLGRTFYDALQEWTELEQQANYMFWPANYWNKGKSWERKARVNFFDTDRKLTVDGEFGIRIQGRASRSKLPKSLNIYARKEYGADSVSAAALFGEDYPIRKLNLNSGANGSETMLTDYLVNKLASDLKFGTRAYEPYVLFLDGEFWGLYWLTPRYKKDYFEGVFGVSGDDVIEIKYKSTELGSEDEYALYEDMYDGIASGDMSDPEQYAQACAQIDIESCIDYYAMEIYIVNIDWPHNNFALWRTREASDQPYADGRWRWLEYDVNISMDPKNARRDIVQRTAARDTMFCSLLENGEFESALYAKLVELAQNNFRPERVGAFIADYEKKMGPAMAKEYARFCDGALTEQDFIDKCEDINTFFQERYRYIMETYGEKYGQKDAR